MPTIYLPPKKKYKRVYKKSEKKDNLNHSAVYNTTTWRTLRIEKLKRDPLCEDCLKKDKIRSASEVHHVIKLSKGKTKKEKQAIGFNVKNLRSLCNECHKEVHQ